ncbi:FKBP-type peptidyl-prolyl cis-trans isomerase [Pedobacter sp. ASV12]|uniref:FKBP-type peptidyl-prolyl cis-trans isomerase n=1 Tax=Pedobacter sp. ASV12 TaxID=2795120 RepID=UPI0018EA6F42|nr:FKBP-type peptidyl-prolyl cis-trans isomerase [Pedobacter sp. ASV12]
MKKSLVILLAATVGLAACNREKKGPGGLLYTIHHSDSKDKIKEGDIVKMDFVQKNDKDSVFFSTYENGIPQVFPVGKKSYAGDMNDVLYLFGEGDSATFKLNLDTMAFYQKQPKPEPFKNDKYMTFTVKIHKVFKKNANEPDSVFHKRANEYFQKDYQTTMDNMKKAEPAKIKAYIADKGLKTKTTPSGIEYVVVKEGSAEKATTGDTLMVNYTGNLIKKDAKGKYKIFDTSDEKIAKEAKLQASGRTYGPTKMVVGGSIPGFSEALTLVGKGGKVTVILPSRLAYGEQPIPQAGIGVNSPLAFDIEIVDIIKGKAPVAAPPVPVASTPKQ